MKSFGKALYNNVSRILGVLLAFCLTASAVIIGVKPASFVVSADDSVGYALKVNSDSAVFFGQNVILKAGNTYIYSYYYKGSSFAKGVLLDGNDNEGSGGASITVSNTVYDEEYCKVSYEFTAPANATVPDSSKSDEVSVYLGIRPLTGESSSYFYEMTVYAKDDVEQKNLFKDSSLNDDEAFTAGKVGEWYTPYHDALETGCFSRTLLDELGGTEFFIKTDDDRFVLKMDTTIDWPWFGQWVSLSPDRTYTFSYYFMPGTTTYPQIMKNTSEVKIPEIKTTYDSEYGKISVTFRPTDDSDSVNDPSGNGNKLVWLGLRNDNRTGNPLYYYDFYVSDTENPSVNLFEDAKLLDNGDEIHIGIWRTVYDTDIQGMFTKTTLASAGGMDIFRKSDSEKYALKANSDGYPFFGQNVSLIRGKTYAFSYYYQGDFFISGAFLDGNNNEGNGGVTVNYSSVVYDEEYCKVTYEFTAPEGATVDPNDSEKVLVYLGIRPATNEKDLYFYSMSVYDKEDPQKTNIFEDATFEKNNGFYPSGKGAWVTPYNTGLDFGCFTRVSLDTLGGMDFFKKTDANRFVLKLEPNSEGGPWFGQQISLKPSKSYTFSHYYIQGTKTYPTLYKDLNETPLIPDYTEYDKKWSKISMTFTPSDDAMDDPSGNGNKLIWVGIRGDYTDQTMYYYDLMLCDDENPDVNLFDDPGLLENGEEIHIGKWKDAYDTHISGRFSKVTLESIGGYEVFERTGNTDPKMMYYTKTDRGPNQEAYGCFTMSFPDTLNNTGKNYVFEFTARSTLGTSIDNFRCYSIDPTLQSGSDYTVSPVSIDGYKYRFNLRQSSEIANKFAFVVFVPKESEGYISNIAMYEADDRFNPTSNRNLLSLDYGDFSQFDVDSYVDLYTKQGGCLNTETGKLVEMPEYFFDSAPDVAVPAGDKMLSYASVWGSGRITVDLPYTVESGSTDGKNYIVSIYIRPTEGRDPSNYYAAGLNGDLVQVYPVKVEGYKYIFNLTEHYRFRLAMDFPKSCEGYISGLEMYEADYSYNKVGTGNLATAFGADGKFTNVTVQPGMSWKGIEFTGGFSNTFVDTRLLEDELSQGIIGLYHSTGGVWPTPVNYFLAENDDGWADCYKTADTEESGTIIGTLSNADGKVVYGNAIVLKSMQDETIVRKAITDRKGSFKFDSVPLGGYEISVTTKDGSQSYGDEYVWVETDKDTVVLSLVYDGDDLLITFPNTGDVSDEIIITLVLFSVSALAVLVIPNLKSIYRIIGLKK